MFILKGIVGVLGVFFVVFLVIFGLVGIFVEGLVFIVGIDCIFDMVRIVVNVLGNFLVVVVILKWEGKYNFIKVKEYLEFIEKVV